jgi:hypothetical protein
MMQSSPLTGIVRQSCTTTMNPQSLERFVEESAHDIRYLLFYLFFIILLSISLYLSYRLSLTPFMFITTSYIRHPTYHLLSVVPSHPTESKSYIYLYCLLFPYSHIYLHYDCWGIGQLCLIISSNPHVGNEPYVGLNRAKSNRDPRKRARSS